ncbi:cytochrome b [Psychromonas antarctica]|uniref:cytochrome b n=1 Tax=Psychromonas antarctica TaxID=67573 RepID=UPI001EE95E69|nr:cytochrome b [Psychromonas antarctica]MCG6200954.1 cytochrome b [Psychromonas antarctica]
MSKVVKQYNSSAKFLHWTSALLIVALFLLGLWMVDLTYYNQWYKIAPYWHKSIGLCLLALTLFRLIWKIITTAPPIEGKKWEIQSAKLAHAAIYLILFCIFISGYMISTADGRPIELFNWFLVPGFGSFFDNQEDIAGVIHFYLAVTLITLSTVHALAALKHHFINKDNTLNKMLRFK